MIYDLMMKATTKAAWDAWLASLSDETRADFLIDEIGPIVITPATYNDKGEELTPAVISNSWHVNLRILTDATDAATIAKGGKDVKWLDPSTVESPIRVWSGCMNYWKPGA